MTEKNKAALRWALTETSFTLEVKLQIKEAFARYCEMREIIKSCELCRLEEYEKRNPNPAIVTAMDNRERVYEFAAIQIDLLSQDCWGISFKEIYEKED